MTNKSSKLILIDGYGYVFRAYHSLPPLTNPQGQYVGALLGFSNMLFKTIREYANDKIIVVLDSGQKTHRHDIYNEYKANRPEAPEDLKSQFPLIRDAAKAFNLAVIEEEGLEADDLIASLAKKAEANNLPVTILSSDKDLMQLIRGNITMFDPFKNKLIRDEEVLAKFGIMPNQVCDYLSLLGDASDNIPGVKGIGAKTAANLLNQFGSLEQIYNSLEEVNKDRIRNLLIDGKENAYLSKKLISLEKPKDVEIDLDKLRSETPNEKIINDFLQLHGFNALKAKIESYYEMNLNIVANDSIILIKRTNIELKLNNLDQLTNILSEERIGIFYLEFKQSKKLFIISNQNVFHYEILANTDSLFDKTDKIKDYIIDFIISVLNNYSIKLISFNLKQLLHFLSENNDFQIFNDENYFNLIDIDLIEYLLPLEEKFSKKIESFEKIKEINNSDVIAQIIPHYDALDENLKSLQKQKNLNILYFIDHKINLLLYKMEQKGIAVSKQKLDQLSNEFAQLIHGYEKQIFQLAGEEFNVGSPKQLGEILFDKLGLETKKKSSKTKNKSTSFDILEDLKSQGHEIANFVLNWRHYSKLRSTYTDALPKAINHKTQRIHTVFHNCLTSTSRLSSSNPNLQNIPIRSVDGDKIRSCFIAGENKIFIGADYSQIELRLLAHMGDVKLLKKAFKENKDIHSSTAAEMFEIAEDQVSNEMRSHAKQINFGIIYGISAFGLAERLNIERKRAKDFIEKYFAKYPEIKIFMDKSLEDCRKNLYVETLLGRKLYFPNINIKNPLMKSFQERAVINAPLQGSASDIVKKSMIDIEKILFKKQYSADLLLQLHDELIYEVDIKYQDELCDIVRNGMEKTIKLDVPLIVNVAIGNDWQSIK